MTKTPRTEKRVISTILIWLAVLAAVVVAVALLSGWFTDKTPGGHDPVPGINVSGPTAEVVLETYEQSVPTVGTVRAIQAVQVGAQLLASVQAVEVRAGDSVEAGAVLVRLDDAPQQARLSRSQAEQTASQARLRQADSDLANLTDLSQRGAATSRELGDAARAREVALANTQAAQQAVVEARAMLAYATVASPVSGRVVDRHVEPGDTVQPGALLVTLEGQLQLEAQVPESLAAGLSVGDVVGVEIDALNLRCEGTVREIVPQASPTSRTFVVKVGGPCPPGVRSGMFGRMFVPLGPAERLTIPADAVRRIGQLESVQVVDAAGTQAVRRLIRTGEKSRTASRCSRA